MPWNIKLQHGGCHVRMSNLHLRKCGPIYIIEGLWSSFRVEVEITRGWPDISACARASTMKGGGARLDPNFNIIVNNLSHNWTLQYIKLRYTNAVAGLEIEAAPFGV